MTPAIVTGAGSSVSSAIVVGHRSHRKLLRHDVIDSIVFRHDVLVKMGEDIRPAVNFWRCLVLRQVRNFIAAKARDLVFCSIAEQTTKVLYVHVMKRYYLRIAVQ